MRKVSLVGAALLSTDLLTAAPDDAGWRGGYGYRRGIGPGAAIGLGIAGLAVGSAIAANSYGYGYGRLVGYYGDYGYPAYGGNCGYGH